ncbi:UNVERIFIED_CONTAM: hypothetical protein PYX00_003826 [Menopon gallinae]|uniref:Uncharacterized protein n=1 Tax=Menopon gallinae TaxID=328185 RepID=A0AAW2I3B5_9NEOP
MIDLMAFDDTTGWKETARDFHFPVRGYHFQIPVQDHGTLNHRETVNRRIPGAISNTNKFRAIKLQEYVKNNFHVSFTQKSFAICIIKEDLMHTHTVYNIDAPVTDRGPRTDRNGMLITT